MNLKKLFATGLIASASFITQAGVINFNFGKISDGHLNSFSLSSGNIDLKVSAWSDTGNRNVDKSGNRDDLIEPAYDMNKYFNNGLSGWGIVNQDEKWGNYWGSCGYSHSADNFGFCDHQDYDFFLLEFSESVSLNSAIFSWIQEPIVHNEVSVVALNDQNKDAANLNGTTFEEIKSNAYGYDYFDMQRDTHYFISNINHKISNSSKFWIVSAYNDVFGGQQGVYEYTDGFKFAGVQVHHTASIPSDGNSTDNSVSVPVTNVATLLFLSLGFLIRRKFKQ